MPGQGTADRYTLISADCHAGGSHSAYREYLDPAYRDDFDAWRATYRNPFKDLGDARRLRNWDNEMRNSQQEADGVVGEVIFPNTVPPFFPGFVLMAPPPSPTDYHHRLAGIRAHNRWLADFCAEFPDRRAGIGQIFLNDVNDAIEDVRWIKELGLRGGALLPNIPPDVKTIKPLYDPAYDTLWAVCEELQVPIHIHGGTGTPDYGDHPAAMLFYINESLFYSQRPLVYLLLSGVFERFPGLRFVLTESGCAWVPSLLKRLDGTARRVQQTGRTGEIRHAHSGTSDLPSDYFARNVWLGVSFPGPDDVAAADQAVAKDRFMWGSDYPHDEGTYPYTREHLRQRFHTRPPDELRPILGGNAAKLYGFDLDALASLAGRVGPTVDEVATPLDQLPDKPNEALLRGA